MIREFKVGDVVMLDRFGDYEPKEFRRKAGQVVAIQARGDGSVVGYQVAWGRDKKTCVHHPTNITQWQAARPR